MKGLAFFVGILLAAPAVQAAEKTDVTIRGFAYSLSASGEVTVTPRRMSAALPVQGHFQKLFEISGRVFVENPAKEIFLLVPPRPRGVLARGLTHWLGRSRLVKFLDWRWADSYLPEVVNVKDLVVDGRRIQLAYVIQGPNGPDIILRSFFDTFSMRALVQQIDAEESNPGNICAQLLNPHGD